MGCCAPATLLIVGLFKFCQQLQVKRKTGFWVDKAHSNYDKVADENDEHSIAIDDRDDDYQAADSITTSSQTRYVFNWTNLNMVFWSQSMTGSAGLVLVAYVFKFAKMAEIDQGCLTCIFSLTTFYVCVLFYHDNQYAQCSFIMRF